MDIENRQELTTSKLIEFARRHNVPLGRLSPSRTITYYIRLGLLPPRLRKSDGRFRWAFAPQSKALLLRIRDLKRNGLTLIQIRDVLARGSRSVSRVPTRTSVLVV
jgi:DNA-binding transcriptional MerR regulator